MVLEATISKFLQAATDKATPLYTLYYEQQEASGASSLDLAFDDQMLDDVELQWKTVLGFREDEEHSTFMQFAEREGMNTDDDDDDNEY